ncbi:MAG TPA: glycosyltransferase family 87 protein [Terriglobia bacterium]|nr:glycosyltransferase family 87 protein [Terriglobia bacterium]
MSLSFGRALIVAVIGLAIAAGYVLRIRDAMVDFGVNYRAGQRLVAGESLYPTTDGHYMFKYLPASAMLYVPLSHLSFQSAKLAWFLISLLALAGSFLVVWRLVPLPHQPYVFVISGLVLAKYFLRDFRLGQINILVTLVMLLTTRALSKDDTPQKAAAGLLAGLATAMKPYSAVFFPYFLVTGNWTALASGIAALAVAIVAPAMFYGWQQNFEVLQEWFTTLSQSTPTQIAGRDNVSVIGFFSKWLGDSTHALVATMIVLAGLAVLMLAVIRRGGQRRGRAVLECAMLLTLIPLISPLGWDYTFLMSLLAVALLINSFPLLGRSAQVFLAVNFAVIALTLFDLMGRRHYAGYMQWSVTTVNFVVIVIALAYLRFRTDL